MKKVFVSYIVSIVLSWLHAAEAAYQKSSLPLHGPSEWALSADDWPLFHHDERNTRCSTSSVPENIYRQWDSRDSTDLNGDFFSVLEISAPLIVQDRVIVSVYGLNKEFVAKGIEYRIQELLGISLGISPLDLLKVPTTLSKIYFLNAEKGTLIPELRPLVFPGRVFLAAQDDKLCIAMAGVADPFLWKGGLICVDLENGKAIWPLVSDFHPRGSITFARNKVLLDSYDDLVCLDAGNNGKKIWDFPLDSEEHITGPPAIEGDKVYFATFEEYFIPPMAESKLYCLDFATGQTVWPGDGYIVLPLEDPSPPAVANGKIYVSGRSAVCCLDAKNGSEVTKYTREGGSFSSPAVTPGGRVYVYYDAPGLLSRDMIYCLTEAAGELIVEWGRQAWSDTKVIATTDEKLLVSSGEGFHCRLYCLDGINDGDEIWPKPVEIEKWSFFPWGYVDGARIANQRIFISLIRTPTRIWTKEVKVVCLGEELRRLQRLYVVCIDRSGSMDGEKIENAKIGAEICIALALRRLDVNPGEGMGIVSYSSTATIDSRLAEVASQGDKDALAGRIRGITAGGTTAIGDGLRRCLNEFVRVSPARSASEVETIILLSDGLHNTGEDPEGSVLMALKDRGVRIFTIGLGDDADTDLLGRLSSATGGRFWFVSDPYELAEILPRIFSQAREDVTIRTVRGALGTSMVSHKVTVDPFLNERADFLLTWRASDLDMYLLTPDGVLIDPATAQADPHVERAEGNTYEFMRVYEPKAGDWTVRLFPVDVRGLEDYTLQVTGCGSVNMLFHLESDQDTYVYPERVLIGGFLTGPVGVKGAELTGTVLRPDGTRVPFVIYDDGLEEHGDDYANDGLYANFFSDFSEDGFYRFEMLAENVSGTTVIPDDCPYIPPYPPGIPSPVSEPVPPFTREAQVTVGISGIPQFINATQMVTTSLSSWDLNWSTGTLFGTMRLTNNPGSTKSLKDKFWYAVQPSDQTRLMHPDGTTDDGLDYVDITDKVLAVLPNLGNGDLKLDPGETVIVPDIEFYSRDRSDPQAFLFAIWADPRTGSTPTIIKSVLRDDDSSLLIRWNAVKGATYRILSSEDMINWAELGITGQGKWRDKTPARARQRFFKIEVR